MFGNPAPATDGCLRLAFCAGLTDRPDIVVREARARVLLSPGDCLGASASPMLLSRCSAIGRHAISDIVRMASQCQMVGAAARGIVAHEVTNDIRVINLPIRQLVSNSMGSIMPPGTAEKNTGNLAVSSRRPSGGPKPASFDSFDVLPESHFKRNERGGIETLLRAVCPRLGGPPLKRSAALRANLGNLVVFPARHTILRHGPRWSNYTVLVPTSDALIASMVGIRDRLPA